MGQLSFHTLLILALLIKSRCTAYSLAGRKALVTGSSGGIGRGIAIELASQGVEVLVHYNVRKEGAQETKAIIENEIGGICAGIVQCDFRDPKNIQKLFNVDLGSIWSVGEGLDILVNNAGVISKLAIEDEDPNLTTFSETLQVNLHAPRLLSQLAMMRMKGNKDGGIIINVSSIHSEKSCEYMSAYAVSKAGLDMLTRAMAIELAPHNIRVNAIAPGTVEVERSAAYFADPSVAAIWSEKHPLQRLGTPKEIAKATIPLITNDWITGTIWQIDGGLMSRNNMPPRDRPVPQPKDIS